MAVRTHYDVLGVSDDASDPTIRAAYRRLAREHHPDRAVSSSAVGGARDMPSINEAYRVLNDPGRRAMYDNVIRGAARDGRSGNATTDDVPSWDASQLAGHQNHRPARVPWRSLLVCASVAIVGVVVLAQFTGSGRQLGPDGILRNGDCVEIQTNGDAREISCTGTDDLVVRAFIPFDGTCPGGTEPHRDRQGMGVACTRLEPAPAVGG